MIKINKLKQIFILSFIPFLFGCVNDMQDIVPYDQEPEIELSQASDEITLSEIPSPDDLPLDVDYIEINNNTPMFTNEELEVNDPFFHIDPLDNMGRVGVADALLDVELMPSDERGSISHIYPTGWDQKKYDVVSGGWLYNRSHLLGHQLTGYDGEDNLMTGTRQFNVDGMLPFENFIAYTIEQEEMQVRYRVTPIFYKNNLVAHGIRMEGFSLDDNGETLSFHVFIPNQQDHVAINYETGSSYIK